MKSRQGFTLVELVVVVMILGILAAVAAPKLLDTSGSATDNGLRQSLAVIRDSIERYAAQNAGKLPGLTTATSDGFKADLATYLRGDFPKCPVGTKDNIIKMETAGTALVGEASPSTGWRYDNTTGEFIANDASNTASDSTIGYDEL